MIKKLLFATIIWAGSIQAMEPETQEAKDLKAKQYQLNRDLLDAAAKGQKEIVLNLLEQGIQPDPAEDVWYNYEEMHALSLAAYAKQEEICKILIDHKANVNYANRRGQTPLMYAVQKKFDRNYDPATPAAICKLLIDHGALVNVHCLTGKTPLIYAHYAKDKMACDILKSHGAITDLDSILCQAKLQAPKEYSEQQQMILYEDFKECTTEFFKPYNFVLLLAVNAHRCCNGRAGSAALLHATLSNQFEHCEDLLEHGVDPNCSDWGYETPLRYAARDNHLKLAQLLIHYGAKVTERKDGRTILMQGAAWSSPHKICETIVEALLRIPNKEQNKKILAFLSSAKKARPEIFNTHIRNTLKTSFQDALYEQNKINFKQSVAYDHIKELKECENKSILLEKYQTN